jgi:hypothetical protein
MTPTLSFVSADAACKQTAMVVAAGINPHPGRLALWFWTGEINGWYARAQFLTNIKRPQTRTADLLVPSCSNLTSDVVDCDRIFCCEEQILG